MYRLYFSWDSRKDIVSSPPCTRCSDESLGARAYFWDSRGTTDSRMTQSQPSVQQRISNIDLANYYTLRGVAPAQNNHNDHQKFIRFNSTRITSARPSQTKRDRWVPEQSGFILNPVHASDSGDYLCRVDFKSSPTKKSFIQLRVQGKVK